MNQTAKSLVETPLGASAAAQAWSDDGFLGSRLQILQPLKGYRAGLDAVLLAASIPARSGEQALASASRAFALPRACPASR